ncbi:hypothetical protein MSAN_01337000 [Mycena sanguinolenta]|uniref:Uncharacterized protein n=1 Tax=Mycena sanguinolenta TaxID=230812 RepID=A0A8H6YG80_9AGAR|nr:hypothetical protein MSAN_01337000 [Mycena sanguinolenta]
MEYRAPSSVAAANILLRHRSEGIRTITGGGKSRCVPRRTSAFPPSPVAPVSLPPSSPVHDLNLLSASVASSQSIIPPLATPEFMDSQTSLLSALVLASFLHFLRPQFLSLLPRGPADQVYWDDGQVHPQVALAPVVTRFILVSVCKILAYGAASLVCALLTWLRAWDHSAAMYVPDNDIFVLITLTGFPLISTSLIGLCAVLRNSYPTLTVYTISPPLLAGAIFCRGICYVASERAMLFLLHPRAQSGVNVEPV